MAIKPDPEMILSIARRLGIKAKEIVYIGDSEVDIITGKKGDSPAFLLPGVSAPENFLKPRSGTDRFFT